MVSGDGKFIIECAYFLQACVVCDEDATLELRVKTVKYFKGIQQTMARMSNQSIAGYEGSIRGHLTCGPEIGAREEASRLSEDPERNKMAESQSVIHRVGGKNTAKTLGKRSAVDS